MSSEPQNSSPAWKSPDDRPDQRLVGTVLAVQANYYQVRLDSDSAHLATTGLPLDPNSGTIPQFLLCTRRSRLKKLGQQVMVGDRVEIEEPDWQSKRAAIATVLPRQSELDRPPVANADQILLVFAVVEPTLDPYQLSRFLIKAESTGIPVCLCLSKRDLATHTEQQQWCDRLAQWGYPPILISIYDPPSLIDLNQQLNQRITVVSGPSGVGKSSLINILVPQAQLRVGSVSGKLARGRHTTRHVELFELPTGGLLADTPGFNQPELNCVPETLAPLFPEIQQRLATASCQFGDCLHQTEPGCVVRGDWERYEHYQLFLEAAIAHQHKIAQLSATETNLKLKTGRQGKLEYEPKLEPKRYRRTSRRTQQQELQSLQQEAEADEDEDDG